MDANDRPGWFDVRIARDRGVVTVTPSGEADRTNQHAFETALRQAAEFSPEVMLLDLRALTFMDVSGLRTILAAASRGRREGWTLIIFRGPPAVQLVFEASGTEETLHLVAEPTARVVSLREAAKHRRRRPS